MTRGGGDVEERNFRYAFAIVAGVMKQALREVFINEWNRIYKSTPWDDTAASGSRLYTKEKLRHSPYAKEYLPKYQNGNTREWDCALFFDAILFSNTLRGHLNKTERNAVNKLRSLRNSVAHSSSDRMDNSEFDSNIEEIKSCFTDLNVSTSCTEELNKVLQEKEKDISFKKLPNNPGSVSVVYEEECDEILSKMTGKINLMAPSR